MALSFPDPALGELGRVLAQPAIMARSEPATKAMDSSRLPSPAAPANGPGAAATPRDVVSDSQGPGDCPAGDTSLMPTCKAFAQVQMPA